jgi:hypothetical protein
MIDGKFTLRMAVLGFRTHINTILSALKIFRLYIQALTPYIKKQQMIKVETLKMV